VNKEPARIISVISAFVTAVIAFAIAFGFNLTDEQRNAILGMIAPTVGIIVLAGEVTRSRVVSPTSAASAVVNAKAELPVTTAVPDIRVSGYKEIVAEKLGARVDQLTFKPPVDAQSGSGQELMSAVP
jgi:hypothetical protein